MCYLPQGMAPDEATVSPISMPLHWITNSNSSSSKQVCNIWILQVLYTWSLVSSIRLRSTQSGSTKDILLATCWTITMTAQGIINSQALNRSQEGVLSHLEYCSVAWNNCGATLTSRLERVQNYALRVILNKPLEATQRRCGVNWACPLSHAEGKSVQ